MVKEIFLKEKHEGNYLGKFLDDSCYDVLLNEDADVYKPIPNGLLGENPRDDKYALLKFRKNVFSEEMVANTYNGIKDAAISTHNRGIAGGFITTGFQRQTPTSEMGREWFSDFHQEVINYFMQPSSVLFDDEGNTNSLQKIIDKYKNNYHQLTSVRGKVWNNYKLEKHNFNFMEWAYELEGKSKQEQIDEARWVLDELISVTDYSEAVYSGIAGYFDRYPRFPYCRETSYTAKSKDKFEKSIPFIEGVSEWFGKLLPTRHAAQKNAIEQIDSNFRIGNSVYTTLTVNKNFRTAAHTDSGDLPQGFGNLTVVSNGLPYEGCYLCFPEYRVAVNIRPGDVLLMDVHEVHGNTKIDASGGGERISLVMYFRENMFQCSNAKYEKVRYDFIEYRRKNEQHPLWNKNWNGVSPGVFSSKEWYDYVLATEGEDFLKQFHPEAFAGTLEDFFD